MSEIVEDYQFCVGNWLGGKNTAYDMLAVSGLGGMPAVIDGDVPRIHDHGYYKARAEALDKRVIGMTIVSYGDPGRDLGEVYDVLRDAFQISDTPVNLKFRWEALGYGISDRMVRGYVRERKTDVDPSVGPGFLVAHIKFECMDPRVYTAAISSGMAQPVGFTGGLTFPLTFPKTFGTYTGVPANCLNEGNFNTWPVYRLTGPIDNARIKNTTTGKVLSITGSLSSGSYLLIDTANNAVLLNGTQNKRSLVDSDADWFPLVPGYNSISLEGESTDSNTALTIDWYSAWM